MELFYLCIVLGLLASSIYYFGFRRDRNRQSNNVKNSSAPFFESSIDSNKPPNVPTFSSAHGTSETRAQIKERYFLPRVQLTYKVEAHGAERDAELPFVIGVIANLKGDQPDDIVSIPDRRFVQFDQHNFNSRMEELSPHLTLEVPNTLTQQGVLRVDLTFSRIEDFSPASVAKQVGPLNRLLEERTQLSNLLTYADGPNEAEVLIEEFLRDTSQIDSLLSATPASFDQDFHDRLVSACQPKSEHATAALKSAFLTLGENAQAKPPEADHDAISSVLSYVAEIDIKLTKQVNNILHHPSFQILEGTWRGLNFLVTNCDWDEQLKLKVLNLSKLELGNTLKRYRGSARDQSPIFKKLSEDEFDQLGGEPYGCIVGDYYFDNSPRDVAILNEMATLCSAIHAPFISAASSEVMHLDSWQDIVKPNDLQKILPGALPAAWQSLRDAEYSRYLALTLPRFLGRAPYGSVTDPVEEFDFEEAHEPGTLDSYIWCNAAYALAFKIGAAFQENGWCVAFQGIESDNPIVGLPVHIIARDDGTTVSTPTEVSVSDRLDATLSKYGLITLMHRKDIAYFLSSQSLHQPSEYEDADATASANLFSRLSYLFACCRFAHYLRCIARDRFIGSYLGREAMENYLNDWLVQYVSEAPSESAKTQVTKERMPLFSGRVVLEETDGDPGYWNAMLYVNPHFLVNAPKPLRLTFRLPAV